MYYSAGRTPGVNIWLLIYYLLSSYHLTLSTSHAVFPLCKPPGPLGCTEKWGDVSAPCWHFVLCSLLGAGSEVGPGSSTLWAEHSLGVSLSVKVRAGIPESGRHQGVWSVSCSNWPLPPPAPAYTAWQEYNGSLLVGISLSLTGTLR